ncbi:MAG: phosphoribosylaminoimidazolesuccinocarboxamide synthase [Calditrichaeota bacterium]|nr:phosphoribosylaminoimidazolesuccinocarboxamide synthase [Calditrichota bacterium]MBT7615696.1 phosphoribosylaminoimidazolesuccinocarboxamide synthase [Calditrichota bacterium]MBT7788335.1 phosphoribosylaminoimidazolesuccinocarboxamide synthase [Calditrichota bacterium]
MEKKELLCEGKAKRLFSTEDPDLAILEFKDDTTAFDGSKKAEIAGKGELNCSISTILMDYLESYHVPTHFVKRLSPTEQIVKVVDTIPIEVVMRNIATGSLVKRLPFEDGKQLTYPIFELSLKNDELGDPLINEYHAYALDLCTQEDIRIMFRMTAKINAILRSFFERRGLILVDFKLEFGRHKNELMLTDEISPDSCRIWDKKTRKKLDKDRFRFDMGGMEQAYQEVLDRIGN